MTTLLLTVPAFAITEAEVEAQVSATSKESVTGNVLIWFLCAVAFLKVSQKIDSFMASLGVNVGHTGGSMIAEAMLATRGVATIASAAGHSFGRTRPSSGNPSSDGSGHLGGFLKGGLAGVVSRKITNDAVRTATTAKSAVHTVTSTAASNVRSTVVSGQANNFQETDSQAETQHTADLVHSSSQIASDQSDIHGVRQTEQSEHHTAIQTDMNSSHTASNTTRSDKQISKSSFKGVGLGGAIFAKSLMTGGSFATDVIGTVAKGDIRSTGSITGDLAAQAVKPYLGYSLSSEDGKVPPTFSNVEIGGGRITGTVQAPGQEPIAFGMYHADQYAEPKESFSRVRSTDGTLWYTQLARDTVERKPYKAPDGSVAYDEQIVKKLPDPPKRKDRI